MTAKKKTAKLSLYIHPQKIEVVNASDVCKAMGIPQDDDYDMNIDSWTFGDTIFSLVGNREFLNAIHGWPEKITAAQEKKYWSIVPPNAYINLEK